MKNVTNFLKYFHKNSILETEVQQLKTTPCKHAKTFSSRTVLMWEKDVLNSINVRISIPNK